MVITAVFDVVYAEDIEVPDGITETEAEEYARVWLGEHFQEVAYEIDNGEIDVKEVWLYE